MKRQYIHLIAVFNLIFTARAFAQVSGTMVTEQHNRIAAGVIEEINLVRSNPAAYAENLEAVKKNYKVSVYVSPTEERIATFEGVTAVDEAIQALQATSPLPALRFSEGMSKAATDHVADQGGKGLMDHKGTDGSLAAVRLSRYGIWQNNIGENINFGRHTPRDIVIGLLIDDGEKSRGHRKNILQQKFAFIGTTTGTHARHDVMTVIVFADDYFDFFRSKWVASVSPQPATGRTASSRPSERK
ncbi:MAG: CAP domain-containing protein [Pyrinomonadaceae bacterium]